MSQLLPVVTPDTFAEKLWAPSIMPRAPVTSYSYGRSLRVNTPVIGRQVRKSFPPVLMYGNGITEAIGLPSTSTYRFRYVGGLAYQNSSGPNP